MAIAKNYICHRILSTLCEYEDLRLPERDSDESVYEEDLAASFEEIEHLTGFSSSEIRSQLGYLEFNGEIKFLVNNSGVSIYALTSAGRAAVREEKYIEKEKVKRRSRRNEWRANVSLGIAIMQVQPTSAIFFEKT